MTPITHFLVSWTMADQLGVEGRDRAVLTWAGVVADLDGLPLLVDLGNRLLGRQETYYYFEYHHMFLHGLPAAVATAVVAGLLATRRIKTALLAFAVFHLHLLCDLLGARGPDKLDIWPIHYLAPLSRWPELAWSWQWPLVSWPNVLLTVLLMGLVFVRAVKHGYSPVMLFSRRADQAFVETLRNRFSPKSQQ